MKNLSTVLYICVLLSLMGCAPHVRMSTTDRESVMTIHINPTVTVPDEMYLNGPQDSCRAAFFGGAFAQGCGKEQTAERIVERMKENNIVLSDIVREQFQQSVSSRRVFAVLDSRETADADLTLTVNIYGLAQPHGFSAMLCPMLNMSASMRRPDGKIIWQATDYIANINCPEDMRDSYSAYESSPALLSNTWAKASRIVSEMLLDDLEQRK